MLIPLYTLSFWLLNTVTAQPTNPQRSCKPLPGDNHWPSDSQWQALNKSVSGHLSAPTPFGAVCHPNLSAYNDASCSTLQTQWNTSLWQESNAWTSMYNDDTCWPAADTPCSTAGYPAYVIEASSAADVQAGVNFARQTGVRLIVKGTGHDVPGRSAGAGSLSIWTHLMTGIDVKMGDAAAVESGAVAAVKLGAGMVWGDVYKAMGKQNLTVVGGSDPHVGVGGFLQAAGHGPLSSFFGLGADNVLEMEVVTADGVLRTINATCNPDLFWAMRGGGPSTFAVMVSVTVKGHPRVAGYEYGFQYNTTASSDTFWTLVGNFSAGLPALSKQGAMGYYYPTPDSGETNRSVSGVIEGTWLFPNKSKAEVDAIIKPLEASLKSAPWAVDPIVVGSEINEFDNFMTFWSSSNPPESVGTNVRYGSWLMDGPALTSNATKLAETLRDITPLPWIWVGHLVAGAGVANAKPAGGSDAVLPAWRKAYVHLLQPREWEPLNATGKSIETKALRNEVQPALRSLAPDSGAYMNEDDPSNPNWKQDYFGEHYDPLLKLKHQWDPNGVFWCKPCVGYDEWDIIPLDDDDESVYERGIGQDRVKLCKHR